MVDSMRGPHLIIFSALCLSLAAVVKTDREANASVPAMLKTVEAVKADCEARGLDTPVGRLGCAMPEKSGKTRRVTQGGAVFIKP